MKIKLTNVRLSFLDLFEAKTVNGEGKPAFSASFLIDPADPQVKVINAAIDTVAKEKWGAKAEPGAQADARDDKVCLHDGNLKRYGRLPGHALHGPSRNATRPLVIDADKSPLTEQDGKPYSGCCECLHRAVGARQQLRQARQRLPSGVQFFRDGDAFAGGRAADADDFDDVTSGAEVGDLV